MLCNQCGGYWTHTETCAANVNLSTWQRLDLQRDVRPNPALGDSELKIVRGYLNEDSEFIETERLGGEYAVAPELLRALKNILYDVKKYGGEYERRFKEDGDFEYYYALIAKAEGKG